MKFAINYSAPAEQLLTAGEIQIDLYKLPAWEDLVPRVHAAHPSYVHFGFLAGRGQIEGANLDWVEQILKTTETVVVNTHLAACADDFPPGEPPTADAVIERVVRDVEYLGRHFGNERVVVENIPYPDPGWNNGLLRHSVDPAVISQVVEATGCGLLLDVAHAVRACEGLGETDLHGYLNALPVAALRELHVVGILPEPDANGIRQDHYPLLPPDWEIVEWSVAQIRDKRWNEPDVMAFEYGGVGEMFTNRSNPSVIAEQVPRLYALAHSV